MTDRANFSSDELSLLYRVAQALVRERDYGELLSDILDATIDGIRAERGFVVVREGDRFHAAVARNDGDVRAAHSVDQHAHIMILVQRLLNTLDRTLLQLTIAVVPPCQSAARCIPDVRTTRQRM